MNAKKGLSSHQLARDLEMHPRTAWYMQNRIRAEMAGQESGTLLHGIIEADETYIGGKPRKPNKREDEEPAKRGRGALKTAIIGAVQRGGQVVARVTGNLTGKGILKFIKSAMEPEKEQDSELITDEYSPYRVVRPHMKHTIINHSEQFADGDVHTNTIEGFWSLFKRAWYGSHHHYKHGYTPLYVAETSYKYNYRKSRDIWGLFIRNCFP